MGKVVKPFVRAINAYELKVTFNKEVDTATAGDKTLYDVAGQTIQSATVQPDGKSVVLKLQSPITTKTSLVVVVDGIATKADKDVTFPKFATTVVVDDQTAPQLVDVTSTTNSDTASKVKLTFSEPVDSGIIKIDGVSVATVTHGERTTEVTGLNLDASKSHTVEVVNLTDGASNVTSLATKTFTITKDTVKPVVSKVEPYGDSNILVTFSKKVDATTVDGNISVKDELLNNVAIGTVVPLPGDDTGTKFLVPIDKATATNFYNTKTTRNLTVLFADNAIKDELGNTLDAVTKNVSLTKDTTGPVVTGVTYKKNSAGQVVSITLNFNEGLLNGTAPANKITVVDGNGVLKTGFLNDGTIATDGEKSVTFNLASPAKLTGKYSFTIAKGLVKDTSFAGNDSAAYATTIDFGSSSNTGETFDINPTNVTSSGNVIKVNFGTAVKGGLTTGSATDVSRYSLNGKPLPAGTTITLDDTQHEATITLPEGTIEA